MYWQQCTFFNVQRHIQSPSTPPSFPVVCMCVLNSELLNCSEFITILWAFDSHLQFTVFTSRKPVPPTPSYSLLNCFPHSSTLWWVVDMRVKIHELRYRHPWQFSVVQACLTMVALLILQCLPLLMWWNFSSSSDVGDLINYLPQNNVLQM